MTRQKMAARRDVLWQRGRNKDNDPAEGFDSETEARPKDGAAGGMRGARLGAFRRVTKQEARREALASRLITK